MKKIAIFLTASVTLTSAFATPQGTTSALYPMDSFNPDRINVSSTKEFLKIYSSEAKAFLKKGEFETTIDYETRIAKGLKTKSLSPDKIYAFKMDSISVKYNPDKEMYEVTTTDSTSVGRLFGMRRILLGADRTSENNLRINKLSRVSDKYKASNAYGRTLIVTRTKGEDFYINSQPFTNVSEDALVFPTAMEIAKKNSSCKKEVYVFGKLNGEVYTKSLTEYGAFSSPEIDYPIDIKIVKKTVPMNIVGMVLKCSTGAVLSVYIPAESDLDTDRIKPSKPKIYKLKSTSYELL